MKFTYEQISKFNRSFYTFSQKHYELPEANFTYLMPIFKKTSSKKKPFTNKINAIYAQ